MTGHFIPELLNGTCFVLLAFSPSTPQASKHIHKNIPCTPSVANQVISVPSVLNTYKSQNTQKETESNQHHKTLSSMQHQTFSMIVSRESDICKPIEDKHGCPCHRITITQAVLSCISGGSSSILVQNVWCPTGDKFFKFK